MSTQTYYCWLRVLPVAKVADEDFGVDGSDGGSGVHLFNWGRPWRPVNSLDRQQGEDLDSWYAERNVGKPRSDAVFHFGAAFRRRPAALLWIESEQGKAWAAKAENFVLLRLEIELSNAVEEDA